MLRSNKKIQRHSELLQLLILHPVEGREAVRKMEIKEEFNGKLTRKQEKSLIHEIKESLNGSDHS